MKTSWKKLRLTEKKLEPPESRPTKDYGRTSLTQYVLLNLLRYPNLLKNYCPKLPYFTILLLSATICRFPTLTFVFSSEENSSLMMLQILCWVHEVCGKLLDIKKWKLTLNMNTNFSLWWLKIRFGDILVDKWKYKD